MQSRGNENEPYEGPQDATPQYQQPYPPQYPQPYPPPYGAAQQPYGPPPQGYWPPPPVQVNVIQNAGRAPVAVRQRLNHGLHITLTFFTGGMWLFVYIPLLMKRRKIIYYG